MLGIVESDDEWEVNDDGCFLGSVDDCGRVIAFPVIETGHPGGRIELSLWKQLEKTIVHAHCAEFGLLLLEIGQNHSRHLIEIGLEVCLSEEEVDVAEEVHLLTRILVV